MRCAWIGFSMGDFDQFERGARGSFVSTNEVGHIFIFSEFNAVFFSVLQPYC